MSDVREGFYRQVMQALDDGAVPFLVGGAVALAEYSGVTRTTKDLDLFIRKTSWDAAAEALTRHGVKPTLPYPHWLGKAEGNGELVDLIFNGGNGLTPVDDGWFTYARDATVFGLPIKMCAPEEMIWSKAFVMERERFDGADVLHLLRGTGATLDWPRLVSRFGAHWRVLLTHLILFDFAYPGERAVVPRWVVRSLASHLTGVAAEGDEARVCRGTLLSRTQYLVDLEAWHYRDAREWPFGPIPKEELQVWTDAIAEETKPRPATNIADEA